MRVFTRVLQAAAIGGLSLPSAGMLQAQGIEEAPTFVDISLLGPDVLFRPGPIGYRVSADPGSYVTVVLISPHGRRTVLNPSDIAFDGAKRTSLVRETRIETEPGESYLVAIATRSRYHSGNLARQSQSPARFAFTNYGAEASLNELLNTILPAGRDHFAAAYVSFRLVSTGFPRTLAYATNCPISPLRTSAALFDGFYPESAFGSDLGDEFGYGDQLSYLAGLPYASRICDDRLTRPFVLASARPPVPQPPRDSMTAGIDSVPNPVRGDGPRIHHPPAPRPLDVVPSTEDGVRAVPVEFRHPDVPVTPPVPVQNERREPVSPRTLAPRVDPMVPVERERPEPVAQPERREPAPAPISSPPPPPTSAPQPQMPPLERHPDATGTGPAIPPPGRAQ